MSRFYNRLYTPTLIAGAMLSIPGPGSLIVIKEASAAFDLEIDDDGKSTYEGGFTIDTGTDKFQGLKVYNRSTTAALTLQMFVGSGSGIKGVTYDYQKVRATAPVSTCGAFGAGVTITACVITGNAANLILIPGIATSAAKYVAAGIPVGARRRQIIVTNNSAADMVLTDSLNNILARFGSGSTLSTSFTFESDADLKLGCLAGSQEYYIAELFNV